MTSQEIAGENCAALDAREVRIALAGLFPYKPMAQARTVARTAPLSQGSQFPAELQALAAQMDAVAEIRWVGTDAANYLWKNSFGRALEEEGAPAE